MQRSVQLITLHCVLVVAEEGSILGASRRVGLHHSALSRRIRDLERVLDVTLFDRHPGGVNPTVLGKRFLDRLRAILTDLDDTLSLEREKSGRLGHLSVGFEKALVTTEFLGIVADFIGNRPNNSVRFMDGSRDGLLLALDRREIDLVFAFGLGMDKSLVSLPLWQERIFAAMSESHPLVVGETIEWTELQGQSLLLTREPDNDWRSVLVETRKCSSTFPAIVHHDIGRQSLFALVRGGFGITVLREGETASDQVGIVAVPLFCNGEPDCIPCFAHWRPDNTNPVLASFTNFLRGRYP